MIGTLLSKLPAPKAADWGWKVTVAIGIICDNGKSVVSVTDQKVSFGDAFSADVIVVKDVPFYANHFALVAGDDAEHAKPILNRAEKILLSLSPCPDSSEEVAEAVDQAFAERLHKEISGKVLRKRGFNVESFRERGRQKCTPSAYLNLCERIDRTDISLKFLVCGFDEEGTAHIYLVDGKSAPKCYDAVGMWAIGSGDHAALACLAFHAERLHFAVHEPAEKAMYFALTAKFMSESSGAVGKSTFACVSSKGGLARYILPSDIGKIRAMWEAEGCPRSPDSLTERMAGLILSLEEARKKGDEITQSASQTSELGP